MVKKISQLAKMAKPKKKPTDATIKKYAASNGKAAAIKKFGKDAVQKTQFKLDQKAFNVRKNRPKNKNKPTEPLTGYKSFTPKQKRQMDDDFETRDGSLLIEEPTQKQYDYFDNLSSRIKSAERAARKTGGKVVKAKKGGGLFGKLAGMAKPVKKKIMKATAPKDAKKVGAAQKVTKEVFKLTEPKSRRTQAGIRDTKGRLSGVSKKQKKIASAIRVGVPLAVGASLISKGDKPKIQTAGASSGGSYKIKSGDTLSQIAKRRGTTLKALLAANPSIKNANKIRVGQTIKMSKPVKKRKSVYQGLSKSRMSKMAMPKKKKMYGGKVVKRDMGGSIGPMNNSKQDMRKERKRKMTAAAKSKYGSSYKGKVKKAIDKVINKKSARTRNETVNKAEKMIKNNPKMFSGRPSSILTEEGFEKVNRKRMAGGKVVKRGKGGSVGSNLVAGCYDT